jgi:hypothetical protein
MKLKSNEKGKKYKTKHSPIENIQKTYLKVSEHITKKVL